MYRETKPGFFGRFKKHKPDEDNEDARTRNEETAG